jgi:hypothetical protein
VKCKVLSGSLTGTDTISKCGDKKNTGGAGTFPNSAILSGSGTITWTGTGTTTVGSVTLTSITSGTCPTGDTEDEVTGDITGGTGAAAKSILTGWTITAYACVSSAGTLSLAPGTKLLINATA